MVSEASHSNSGEAQAGRTPGGEVDVLLVLALRDGVLLAGSQTAADSARLLVAEVKRNVCM